MKPILRSNTIFYKYKPKSINYDRVLRQINYRLYQRTLISRLTTKVGDGIEYLAQTRNIQHMQIIQCRKDIQNAIENILSNQLIEVK